MNGFLKLDRAGVRRRYTETFVQDRFGTAKALAILMYSMETFSYHWIGKLLNVSSVAVYKWVRSAAANIPEPEPAAEVLEME